MLQTKAQAASLSEGISSSISNQQNIVIAKAYLSAINAAAKTIAAVSTSGGQSLLEIDTDFEEVLDDTYTTLVASLSAMAMADADATTVQNVIRFGFFEVYVAPGTEPNPNPSVITASGTAEWTDIYNSYAEQYASQIGNVDSGGVVGVQSFFATRFTLDEWVNTVSPALDSLSSARSSLNTNTSLNSLQTATVSEIQSKLVTYNNSLDQASQAIVSLLSSKFDLSQEDALNLAKLFSFSTAAPVNFYRE